MVVHSWIYLRSRILVYRTRDDAVRSYTDLCAVIVPVSPPGLQVYNEACVSDEMEDKFLEASCS